jgi:UMF1 family MFS transporter
MYDWAVSSVQTTIMVAVFPIYFVRVAGADYSLATATQYFAIANSVVLAITAVVSPMLGALADYLAIRKRLLGAFMLIGAAGAAGMFFIQRGDIWLASVLYVVALAGASVSFVFYESLLPHVARPDEVDRVSTAGYAIGYVGGGVLLALNLAWISKPAWFGLPSGPGLTASQATLPSRLALLSAAAWWLIFSIPLFRRVPEPPRRVERDETASQSPVATSFRRLGETVRELRAYRHAFVMLLAFLLYNDGIQTIIKMATAYGTEIGIEQNALILAILIVQFVGIPFAFLFGMLADRIGAKRCVFLGLIAYMGISILGYFMTTATHFFILAGMVGMVQGGTQALSRSLFSSMVPPHKSGEFFGFFSIFEKFAGIFGPLFYAAAIALTGSSRNAVLSVIFFFIAGALVLTRVDVDEGRRVAREAEEATRPVAAA